MRLPPMDLEAGRLVRLTPAMWDGSERLPRLPALAARRRDKVLGPAGRWLFERLTREGAAGEHPSLDGRAAE